MHFSTPINNINEIKNHKLELKSSRNYLTNHIKSKSQHWPKGGHTDTQTYTHTQTYVPTSKSDFRKPGTCLHGLNIQNHICKMFIYVFVICLYYTYIYAIIMSRTLILHKYVRVLQLYPVHPELHLQMLGLVQTPPL